MRDIIRIQRIGRNQQISTKESYLILFFRDGAFFRKISLITIKIGHIVLQKVQYDRFN